MFPQLKNKKFIDISTNKTFSVIDQFENIAILDNKQRVDVKRLLDPSYYDEYIDPVNFFNQQSYQIFTEKIKSIPDEALQNIKEDDEPAVTVYDPEEEKRLLEQRARNINPQAGIIAQMDKFKDLIDDDIRVIDDFSKQTQQTQLVQPELKIEDPIISMFKNVKRNTEFKITLDVNNKIPRPDFIEMMEDSYETSIIEYLADEFTKSLINDPSVIKNKIIEEIKSLVYKKEVKRQPKKPIQPKTKFLGEGEDPKNIPPPPSPPPARSLKEGKQPPKPASEKKEVN